MGKNEKKRRYGKMGGDMEREKGVEMIKEGRRWRVRRQNGEGRRDGGGERVLQGKIKSQIFYFLFSYDFSYFLCFCVSFHLSSSLFLTQMEKARDGKERQTKKKRETKPK